MATKIRGNVQIMDGTIENAQIADDAAIALSKIEDGTKILLCDDAILSANLNANGNKITNLGSGSASTDACTYGQLQEIAVRGKNWKELVLHNSQLVNASGIASAQIIKLTSNLQPGDILTINNGSSDYIFTANNDFNVGASINETLSNLADAINATSAANAHVTDNLGSLDPTNNILVLIEEYISQDSKVYGDADFASRAQIIDPSLDSVYEADINDLVSMPSSAPASTNFGFSRVVADLTPNETHLCRVNDATYTWDSDNNTWNISGSTTIPYASSSVYGKVRIGEGIAVSSGIISVNVDDVTLEISGNEVQVKEGSLTAAHLAVSGINFSSDAGSYSVGIGGTFVFTAGEGIDVQISGNSLITTGEDASTTNKGIARFDSSHFSVSAGVVSLLADGIDETLIDWGSGSNQIDASSIPIDMGGTYSGAATNVQDALEEVMSSSSPWTISGSDLYYSTGQVRIGTSGSATYGLELRSGQPYTTVFSSTLAHGTASFDPGLYLRRSRGTSDSPTGVADDDSLGSIIFSAHDNSQFRSVAKISVSVNGIGTGVGGKIQVQTSPTTDNELYTSMTVFANGHVNIGTDSTNTPGELLRVQSGITITGAVGSAPGTIGFDGTNFIGYKAGSTVLLDAGGTLAEGWVLRGNGSNLAIPVRFVVREAVNESADGSRVAFTVDYTPISGTENVHVNGILMDEGSGEDYTLSSKTITFGEAPLSGSKIRVSYLASD